MTRWLRLQDGRLLNLDWVLQVNVCSHRAYTEGPDGLRTGWREGPRVEFVVMNPDHGYPVIYEEHSALGQAQKRVKEIEVLLMGDSPRRIIRRGA